MGSTNTKYKFTTKTTRFFIQISKIMGVIVVAMDKLRLIGKTWAEFSTLGMGVLVNAKQLHSTKIAQDKVENLAQTTSRLVLRHSVKRHSA